MSLYNMVNGVNQAAFYFLPLLGKHYSEYPRFRDCFIGQMENSDTEVDQFGIPKKEIKKLDERLISIYTRVGGGNREDYEGEIDALRKIPEYVRDYDDDFDCTFATFVFNCPKKWEKDYDLLREGKLKETSADYKKLVYEIYPKIADKLKEILE